MAFFRTFRTRLKYINTELIALYYSLKHPATPILAKGIVFLALGYVISPIDFVPEFIPFLGLLDDIIIFPAMMAAAVKVIPGRIMEESRKRARKTFVKAILLALIIIIILVLLTYWLYKAII